MAAIERDIAVTVPAEMTHDQTLHVHVHIHLSEDEARRLLLPHIADAFAGELERRTPSVHALITGGTTHSLLSDEEDRALMGRMRRQQRLSASEKTH